jgi:amino acid adenylation domain-containing protein
MTLVSAIYYGKHTAPVALAASSKHPRCNHGTVSHNKAAARTAAQRGEPDVTLDLLERFAERARNVPDAVAIEASGIECSYGALQRHALAVTCALQEAGCVPGDRVAVWTNDRAALVAMMLGILNAGAVFVPLEHNAPGERLRLRLGRLRARVLLHDAHLVQAARGYLADAGAHTCEPIAIPGDDGLTHQVQSAIARLPTKAPAYIYFTSGSSAQPKAIVGSLAALADRIAWEIETFSVQPGTRCSQLVTATFDPWFRDIFVPLCAGGTIVIPPDFPSRLEPERIIEWLRDARIELMHCGPSLINAMVSAPARIRRLPALRIVLSSGETLHVSLVRRWRRRYGRAVELVNLYGPTEATMAQFWHRVEAADTKRSFIPVGRPLPGVKIQLIDREDAPCAPGQTGEIFIGGRSLSLGYCDNPEATERAFVRRGTDAQEIYYRTGDLGIEYEPGRYRLLGRTDDQIKIRGVRVEPREVEDALIGYPLIASCAVVARPDRDGEPSLIAYVVPETPYPPAIPEMRAYLRERFPAQCLPAAFVTLKALPLTATGKVDRQSLPDPGTDLASRANLALSPRNALEAALAQHWREVLGLPEIGVEEDFLDVGGHSLSAMRLVSALSEAGVGELSLLEIFEHPTIAAQAALLQMRSTADVLPVQSAQTPCAPPAYPAPAAAARSERSRPVPAAGGGHRRCNLVLVISPDVDRESLERAARIVGEIDDRIDARAVADVSGWDAGLAPLPTLVVSPGLLRHRPALPAQVCCGFPLAKSEEYRILERAGVPVPKWVVLEDGLPPDLSGFGAYVVRKPDYGAKGAEVRIVRRERVRWKPIVTSAAGPSPRLLVQEFVYTGAWPVSYRVNTLFGRMLYSIVITANKARQALTGPEDFDARGDARKSVSIVSNARDSSAVFCTDQDVIALGERAARAFPDVPLLGVDILKNALTGRLAVTEVNSLGHNWNFGPEFLAAIRVDVERQFDGVRRAAMILAQETQLRVGSLDWVEGDRYPQVAADA